MVHGARVWRTTGFPLGAISEFPARPRRLGLPRRNSMEQAMQAQATIQAKRPPRLAAHHAAHVAAQVARQIAGRLEHRVPPASHMLFGSPELTGIPIAYDRNAEIYGEGEVADYVYKVI